MRTYDWTRYLATGFSALLVFAAVSNARAFEQPAKLGKETTPAAAYAMASEAYRAGHKQEALTALQFAARGGHAVAQWRLARMYADGDGVKRNELKAFEYFRSIADQHADDSPSGPYSRLISESFIELAGYYLEGLPEAGVAKNISRAFNLLQHAATYFGDAEAQYQLGKIYLAGDGVEKSPRRAANWLMLAAGKQHVGAQCALGLLLYNGADGVARRPVKGLVLLEVARRQADAQHDAWIINAHDTVFANVDAQERGMVADLAERWMAKRKLATN